MNLTGDNVAPYKVNHFTWSKSTKEVVANITISSSYIGAETDLTVELKLDQEDKINRDPNQNYFMPKQCFSITKNGQIYANREKLMRITNTNDLSVLNAVAAAHRGYGSNSTIDREVYQWEFDKQAYKDDINDYGCIKSINTVVWQNADRFIMMTLHENEHIKDRAEFIARQLVKASQQLEVVKLDV
jgi:hypothetical protein